MNTRGTHLTCALAILFMMVAGACFAGGQGGTAGKVTIMLPSWGESIKDDNPILVALGKHIGAELSIISVPKDVYPEKVETAIASQALPMAMVVWDQKTTTFLNAARGGMFWEVGPYLKSLPNFKDINPIIIANSSIDGKLFGIPRERPLIRRVISIRADWLRKLNLSPPGTLDELYNVAKAFTTRDPDGNGKQDTTGLGVGVSGEIEGINVVAVAAGAPNYWGEREGKLVFMIMTPEFLDALNWYKKLYDEKCLNQDFVTVKDSYTDFFETEKAGFIFDWVCSYKGDPLYETKMKQDPTIKDGDLVDQYFLEAKDGTPRIPSEKGILGLMAFPKPTVKNEADLKRILAAFAKLDDKVAQDLMTWGIEGVHYKIEGGVPAWLPGKSAKDVGDVGQLGFSLSGSRSKRTVSYAGDPALARVMDLSDKNIKYLVPDLSVPLFSETYATNTAAFNQVWEDAVAKYIVGAIDLAGWNKAVSDWRKMGGDKIIEEYTAAYKLVKGK